MDKKKFTCWQARRKDGGLSIRRMSEADVLLSLAARPAEEREQYHLPEELVFWYTDIGDLLRQLEEGWDRPT